MKTVLRKGTTPVAAMDLNDGDGSISVDCQSSFARRSMDSHREVNQGFHLATTEAHNYESVAGLPITSLEQRQKISTEPSNSEFDSALHLTGDNGDDAYAITDNQLGEICNGEAKLFEVISENHHVKDDENVERMRYVDHEAATSTAVAGSSMRVQEQVFVNSHIGDNHQDVHDNQFSVQPSSTPLCHFISGNNDQTSVDRIDKFDRQQDNFQQQPHGYVIGVLPPSDVQYYNQEPNNHHSSSAPVIHQIMAAITKHPAVNIPPYIPNSQLLPMAQFLHTTASTSDMPNQYSNNGYQNHQLHESVSYNEQKQHPSDADNHSRQHFTSFDINHQLQQALHAMSIQDSSVVLLNGQMTGSPAAGISPVQHPMHGAWLFGNHLDLANNGYAHGFYHNNATHPQPYFHNTGTIDLFRNTLEKQNINQYAYLSSAHSYAHPVVEPAALQPFHNHSLFQCPSALSQPALAASQLAKTSPQRFRPVNISHFNYQQQQQQRQPSYKDICVEKIRRSNVAARKAANTRLKNARYFIIKSYSEDDVHRSIKYGIWCSTKNGNKKLDDAFREHNGKGPVILLFSVNESCHFCGIAQMTSGVDYEAKSDVWQLDRWHGKMEVEWICVKDVPNLKLKHIKLENNDDRSVTFSRDTQEVLGEKGRQVFDIILTCPSKSSLFDDFDFYEQRQHYQQQSHTSSAQPRVGNTAPIRQPHTTVTTRYPSQHHHQQQMDQRVRMAYVRPPTSSISDISGVPQYSMTIKSSSDRRIRRQNRGGRANQNRQASKIGKSERSKEDDASDHRNHDHSKFHQ